MAGSHSQSTLTFLRNCPTVFQSGHTILHSCLHMWGFQFLLILANTCNCQIFFFDIAVSVVIWWYLMVVLICIPLMAKDADQLFRCMLVIPMPALVRCLFKSSTHFLTGIFVFLLNCKSSLYILDTSLLLYIWFTNAFFRKTNRMGNYFRNK